MQLKVHNPAANKNKADDTQDTLEPTPLKQSQQGVRQQKDNAEKQKDSA